MDVLCCVVHSMSELIVVVLSVCVCCYGSDEAIALHIGRISKLLRISSGAIAEQWILGRFTT